MAAHRWRGGGDDTTLRTALTHPSPPHPPHPLTTPFPPPLTQVAMRGVGDYFGEVALLFDQPRNATVAATQDAVVWVLERGVFRHFVRAQQEEARSEVHVFMNQVKILQNLSEEEQARLVDAFEVRAFPAGTTVVRQGDPGDFFYIIKAGEAEVNVEADGTVKKVNHLFK